jgi:large subunit ribosomal protein L7/L12
MTRVSFISGTRHPHQDDLRALTDDPETGSVMLPCTIPLLNVNRSLPLSREPVYGVDLVLQSQDRAKHAIVFGPTGAGKNVSVLDMLRYSSLRDPLQTTITFSLKASDYGLVEAICRMWKKKLVVVNLNDAWRSTGWNPLATKHPDVANDRIRRFADSVRNPSSHDSEFWTQWVKVALKGAWEAGYTSFPSIYQFFSCPRQELVNKLKMHGNTCSLQLAGFLAGDSSNAQTVLASIVGAMSSFLSENVMRVMSKDELNLSRLLKNPVCLHIEMPETSLETQQVLYQMLARTVTDELINAAEETPDTAPPATIFYDDMPSLGYLLSPGRLLTMRSRGIGVVAGVQSLSSLELVYGTTSRALIDNFHTKIILPGGPASDAAFFAESSGEQMVGLPAFEGQSATFVNRPLLSAASIRTPSYSHPLFGMPATIMVGAATFQAYLQRSYEHPSIAGILRETRGVTGRERLRKRRIGLKTINSEQQTVRKAEKGRSGFSDTRGWSESRIREKLDEVLKQLEWQTTSGSARKWWLAFEQENANRMALVLRLAEELAQRKATITEFFLAYGYSNTDNIQANLCYLDYTRLKKSEEKKQRESANRTADVTSSNELPKLSPAETADFHVTLQSYGDNKLQVIKVVKQMTGLSLLETKQLVESAPAVIGSCERQDDADRAVSAIQNAGGHADIA